MKNTMVVFGGQDNEEQAARNVAREAGCVLATATVSGTKVHGGNAYQADGYVVDEGDFALVQQVIIFEVNPNCAGSMSVVGICDHHNPGDFGYGLGADRYWDASSLGQLCAILGVERTHQLELVAAGDHCPADAYAGRCSGIDPEEFLEFRIKGKAAFYATNPRTAQKADEEKIREFIAKAKDKLQEAKVVDGVRDLREAGLIDELPEAALVTGEAYIAMIDDVDRDRNPTGNKKIVLGGHTTPEIVNRFMGWGNSLPNRIGNAYGNPTRGFAGVVVKG
ncbi:MAG: hypothetical protein OEV93_00325 [Candidatus Moranbacteria bacterium]|nr:hypothetical protein [Candidatus Moranbacteria bacterium]